MLYFATVEDSAHTETLWGEFDKALADVVSCSTCYRMGERTDRLLLPLLLWAMTRCLVRFLCQ